ncbi:hypothetical protein QTN38_013810 [Enterobacter cloacae subsp. cloacae]|jgi:hypothetical protein|uniref:hypothetical protein n=1 Tax=Enterobacter cloacae TaxID=550 RepID=UPI0007B39AE7|nr:hypothetical protein [Enterobacter cloacae]EMC0024801.1 hypothetical protein [Enterobacter cloacae]KZQ35353.1 hypothetical protein A3N57_19470 [Enterobacter cloacae subsp. dissolvens]MBT1833354.1 hypothetical protein [Enterobacter cloacae]MCK7414329.1 hypothetical protein [Enterobacter cloacae]MCK7436716.1 hypothetical protein [Enterobacter cloacae]
MAIQSRVVPGYCVVQQPGTLDFQARQLFGGSQNETTEYFMQLNRDTSWLKPGQILIVADPNNDNQSYMINSLLNAKKKINNALATIDASAAEFLKNNYEKIKSITFWGETAVGNASGTIESYFKQIESILVKIEGTYQNQFRTQGTLISQQFYHERNALFAQLKPLLNNITRKQLKFKDYTDLKRALGLSTKSIVHEWSTVGVGAIPGYSTYIDRASKITAYMKAGGWVALGFSFMNTSNEVYHACTVDREDECGKVAVTEYSKFGGGVAGAALGSTFAAPICLALGVPTAGAGTLVCGLIVGAVGAAGGTQVGGFVGEQMGNLIFSGD